MTDCVCGIQVVPVTSFPDDAVNVASASLVQRHSTAFPNERTLMQVRECSVVQGLPTMSLSVFQRHCVRVVPVAEATCSWNSKTFNYFVYGKDELVYAPTYPQRCCWGCAIL